MMRFLRKLARNRSGTATIELALCAPILATMVIGVSDISIAYGKKLELEQAAQRAMEKVMQTTGEDTLEPSLFDEGSVPGFPLLPERQRPMTRRDEAPPVAARRQ